MNWKEKWIDIKDRNIGTVLKLSSFLHGNPDIKDIKCYLGICHQMLNYYSRWVNAFNLAC